MTPEALYLIISIFGKESMRAGPFDSIKSCVWEQTVRSAELNVNYSKLPRGTGMSMFTVDDRGKINGSRQVMRGDITMECKFEGKPDVLRGPLG